MEHLCAPWTVNCTGAICTPCSLEYFVYDNRLDTVHNALFAKIHCLPEYGRQFSPGQHRHEKELHGKHSSHFFLCRCSTGAFPMGARAGSRSKPTHVILDPPINGRDLLRASHRHRSRTSTLIVTFTLTLDHRPKGVDLCGIV